MTLYCEYEGDEGTIDFGIDFPTPVKVTNLVTNAFDYDDLVGVHIAAKDGMWSFRLHGYPSCCGILIAHGLEDFSRKPDTKETLLKLILEIAKYWDYSQVQYVVTNWQTAMKDALLTCEFKKKTSVVNHRSGHTLLTYVKEI